MANVLLVFSLSQKDDIEGRKAHLSVLGQPIKASHTVPGSSIKLEWYAQKLSVKSTNTSRLALLNHLADSLDALILINNTDTAFLDETINIEFRQLSLESGLEYIVNSRDFTVHYQSRMAQREIDLIEIGRAKVEDIKSEPIALNHTTKRSQQPVPQDSENPIEYSDLKNVESSYLQLQEQDIHNREFFDSYSAERQRKILSSLNPVAQDLELLSDTLLYSQDSTSRIIAAKRLGLGESYAATHALFQALEDHNKEVVETAVNSLAALEDSSIRALLEKKLKSAQNPLFREAYNNAFQN